MQKITPFLWFDDKAEEAANFYVSIFKNSKIGKITRYPKEAEEVSGKKAGEIMTVDFEIEGQKFTALNGGPPFKFTEAVSFIIDCNSQEEVDYYWNQLTEGGDEKSQICGWLKDKYGVSWQVVPRVLEEMLADEDKEKAGRVMTAMLGMKKIIVADLEKAYDQK
jgi:predicted 3-demethylubiquinone-9 3-methyltransferase (glyoxalase superfamily)